MLLSSCLKKRLTALKTSNARLRLPVDRHALSKLWVSASATSRTAGSAPWGANSCSFLRNMSKLSRSDLQDAACKRISSSAKLFQRMLLSIASSTFSWTGSRLFKSTVKELSPPSTSLSSPFLPSPASPAVAVGHKVLLAYASTASSLASTHTWREEPPGPSTSTFPWT